MTLTELGRLRPRADQDAPPGPQQTGWTAIEAAGSAEG
jgi:hypothetical protein